MALLHALFLTKCFPWCAPPIMLCCSTQAEPAPQGAPKAAAGAAEGTAPPAATAAAAAAGVDGTGVKLSKVRAW